MYADNPSDYAEELLAEDCPACPHGQDVENPIIWKLLDYMGRLDVGCPVGEHTLRNEEWDMIVILKNERARLTAEEAKEKRDGKH